MNWKIWSLTLFGIIMGFASVYGYTKKYEFVYWLIIAIISAIVIAKVADRQIFTKGVVVGLFMGIFTAIIQATMFDTFLLNNPESIDGFKSLPVTMEPQYVVLFMGPFIGIIYGLFIGLLAFLFDKFSGKRIQK